MLHVFFFLNDASVTFIVKTDPENPSMLEDFWRTILKIIRVTNFYSIFSIYLAFRLHCHIRLFDYNFWLSLILEKNSI